MQGRLLIRAVEFGLIAAVLGAATLLAVLVWSAHRQDRDAGAIEAEIVRQMLEPEIAAFRQGLAQAAIDPQGWTELDRQRQFVYPPRAGGDERPGRIAQLVGIGAARQGLERLREGYARGDLGKARIDFAVFGAGGGEELALIAPVAAPEGGKPPLAIALVDFSELTQRLERLSIHLLPLQAPGMASTSRGALHLTGVSGDVVAVLAWKSARASDLIRQGVIPTVILVFAAAMAGLVALLGHIRVLADRLAASPLELPQSAGEIYLAAGRNPAKVVPSLQVS